MARRTRVMASSGAIDRIHPSVASTRRPMPTILVIDDSASIRQAISAMLRQAGYRVLEAANGSQALICLRDERPDLVLTDIYMPDGDGFEVLMALQTRPDNPPVIAMSSELGHLDLSGPARHLGAKRFLQKPFTADDLLAGIDAVLAGPRAVRERQAPLGGASRSGFRKPTVDGPPSAAAAASWLAAPSDQTRTKKPKPILPL